MTMIMIMIQRAEKAHPSILGHLRRRPSLSHHSLETSDGEYGDGDDDDDDDNDDDGDDDDDDDDGNNGYGEVGCGYDDSPITQDNFG